MPEQIAEQGGDSMFTLSAWSDVWLILLICLGETAVFVLMGVAFVLLGRYAERRNQRELAPAVLRDERRRPCPPGEIDCESS